MDKNNSRADTESHTERSEAYVSYHNPEQAIGICGEKHLCITFFVLYFLVHFPYALIQSHAGVLACVYSRILRWKRTICRNRCIVALSAAYGKGNQQLGSNIS